VAVGTTSLRVLQTVHDLALAAAPPGTVRTWPETVPGNQPPPVFAGEAVREPVGWRVSGTTRLFLRPPTPVVAAAGLVTNFHLPGSSLLMLVAAFAGERAWREAYALAVSRRLRFYSYGDAMLVLPPGDRPDSPGEGCA